MVQKSEERLAEALLIAKQMIDERDEKIRQLTPKAQYTDRVLSATNLHTVTSIAVHLRISGKKLNEFLIQQDWIYRVGRDLYPTYKISGRGYCDYHIVEYGDGKTREHLKWTELGRKAVIELWNNTHKELF